MQTFCNSITNKNKEVNLRGNFLVFSKAYLLLAIQFMMCIILCQILFECIALVNKFYSIFY